MENNENEKIESLEETSEITVEKTNETPTIEETQEIKQPEILRVPDDGKKKKSKKGLVICLILIIIVAAIGCAYFFLANKPEAKKTTTKSKEVYSKYRMTGNDLQDFDLYFLQLENPEKNSVYSPLSIKYALEMLGEGSKGESKAQIDEIVGDYKAKKYTNSSHMSFANAMFVRNDFKDNVKEEYTKLLTDKYNAEIQYADFNSAKPMNDWVSNKTFKLINNLFKDSDVNDKSFIIMNALAIDMNWNNQIQCEASNSGVPCIMYSVDYAHEKYSDFVPMIEDASNYDELKFNDDIKAKSLQIAASLNNYDIIKDKGEDKIREEVGAMYKDYVAKGGETCGLSYDEYMDGYIESIGKNYKKVDYSTDFLFYDDDSVKSFAKDLKTYDGTTLQYVGIMPKKDNLATYVKGLDANKLNGVVSNLKELKLENVKEGTITHIKGHIPVFKYDYKLDFINDLNKLGIKDVFDINKANLGGLIKEGTEKQYIADASHQATIEFSNEGIRAAAVTQFGGAGAAGCDTFDYKYEVPIEEIDLTFDKPYMYIIRDKDSGEVWFVGTIYEPIKK